MSTCDDIKSMPIDKAERLRMSSFSATLLISRRELRKRKGIRSIRRINGDT
jgi:hypothetical protein